MSASAYGGLGRSLHEELSVVMVFQVENPEGRSAVTEAFATMFDGVVVKGARAASQASRRKPPREIPACPFVVHSPKPGQRELDAVLRAERRGWWPMIACREFRLSAEHPQVYRVRVMPLHEPVYEPDPLGLAGPVHPWAVSGGGRAVGVVGTEAGGGRHGASPGIRPARHG